MCQTGQNGSPAQGSSLPTPPPYNFEQQIRPPTQAQRVERRPMHDFNVRAPNLIWADEYFRLQNECLQLRKLPAGENFDAALRSVELQVRMFEAAVPKAGNGTAMGQLSGLVYKSNP